MKTITITLIISSLFSFNTLAKKVKNSANKLANYLIERPETWFARNYTGKIDNKLDVVFQLNNNQGAIAGYYFYQSKGIEIKLKGELKNDSLLIFELNHNGEKVAKIQGLFKGKQFNGRWIDLKSAKSLPIAFSEVNLKIPPLPANLEGNYKNANGTACTFALSITKKEGEYFYRIKTDQRQLNGKIHFFRSLTEQQNYIIFKGIKWAENEGALDEDGEPKVKDLKIPTDIEGLLSESEIQIQNSGNAMNSYVKFYDCGDKYISLTKK
ncbi:hypothetical protein D3C80_328490 [compost metagenome]